MRQLDGHEARFLYEDSDHANANVTLVHIYDPSTAPGGRVRFKQILAHIEARLHRSPVFRRRLLRVPLGLDDPYWIEDERFDLEYHVRHIALPAPGDWRQFCIQASRIHARPLDLSRPLWEIHVIEGLHGLVDLPAGSFALLTKIHHAAIDPEAGSELTMLLHDTDPVPPPLSPPEPWFPESPPGWMPLLSRGIMRTLGSPLRLARPLTELARHLAPAATALVAEALLRPDQFPVTRFNAVVSPHRVFETRRFPLADVQRIRSLVRGTTVNEVVIAVCAGALRRYLEAADELPNATLAAIAPVTLRGTDDEDGAPALVLRRTELGTHLADPIERLRFLRAQSRNAPSTGRAIPREALRAVQQHTPALNLSFVAKAIGGAAAGAGRRAPLAHCTLAQVPGPTVPLYLGGARMSYFSAIMPIADGMGLVFAVTSYEGMLIISPTACREQVPDPARLAQCLRDSFQEYLAQMESPAQTRPRKLSRPRVAVPIPASASGTTARASRADRRATTRPRAATGARRRSTAPVR